MKNFPVYRKYTGINVWFKITTERHFIELKQIGSKFTLHEVTADQYPEVVFIQDMINCHEGRWEPVKPEVFEEKYAQLTQSE